MNVESINEVSIIPPFHPYCLRHVGRSVLVRGLPRASIVRVITKLSGRQAPVLNSLSYHPVFKNKDQGSGPGKSAKHLKISIILLRIKGQKSHSMVSL